MTVDLFRQLGFLLLGGLFVWAGFLHFLTFKEVVAQMAEKGIAAPAPLLAAGSVVELIGGFLLIVGFARPLAAIALILFTAAASLMMLDFWRYSGMERLALRSAFLTNVALIGGLILAAPSPEA
jgi:putative oxidoreductase